MFKLQGINGEGKALLNFLKSEVVAKGYKRISACAAYATFKGVVLVRNLLAEEKEAQYRWLIGLDDNFSDPQAIRIAMSTKGAETRLAKLLPNRRFHPKAYLLDLNEAGTATLVIGSCNLTEAALTKNCEVFAIHRAETQQEIREAQKYWDSLWGIGQPATESSISEYKEKYKRSRHRAPIVKEEAISKKPSQKIKKAIKESVKTTSLAWIVIGKNTGGGSQLDIVKNLAPFLSLPRNPQQGDNVNLSIKSVTGIRNYQITFTKGMWRFMNLQQGFSQPLRPDPNKASPYILVIERPHGGNNLEMKVLNKNNPDAKQMMELSKQTGFIEVSSLSPSGRLYGWY